MQKIKSSKKIDNENSKPTFDVVEYDSIHEAARAIDSKFEPWKVEMLIANAINTNKRAFGAKWFKV